MEKAFNKLRTKFRPRAKGYSGYVERLESSTSKLWQNKRWLCITVLSAVVVIWNLPYITSHGLIAQKPGDSDYFFQLYEAIRKSIVQYGQFPWWNPWVGGGVPLFANPQAGVFSLQTVLVLVFGSVIGLKLSIVVYNLIGFWGAFVLLRKNVKASHLVAAVLSFCWIANGFFVAHLFDHYTFIYFMLVPLGIHLQLEILKRRYWLYFGLFLALMALASFHYAFLQSVIIFGAVAAYQLGGSLFWKTGESLELIKKYSLAAGVFVILAGLRIAYTVQYVFDFPKSYAEPANPLTLLLKGLLTPGANANVVKGAYLRGPEGGYSLGEYSAYVGVMIFAAVICIAAIVFSKIWSEYRSKKAIKLQTTTLTVLLFLGFLALVVLVAKGGSDGLAPFSIIKMIPGYTNMRVPSRWLIWFGLISIVLIAYFVRTKTKGPGRAVVLTLVALASIELAATGAWYMRAQFTRKPVEFRSGKAEFIQYENYNPSIQGEAAVRALRNNTMDRSTVMFEYESTRNNMGELFGYEPLNLTLFDTMGRCGINKGCSFVDSKNADLVSWSPNKIELRRKAAGEIVLNTAPSNYWTVNGKRLDPLNDVIGNGKLVIRDESQNLTLSIEPKGPLEVIKNRIK